MSQALSRERGKALLGPDSAGKCRILGKKNPDLNPDLFKYSCQSELVDAKRLRRDQIREAVVVVSVGPSR